MLNNYDALKSAVSAWLLRDSSDLVVTDDRIEDYITLCEAELNRELKIQLLEETAPLVSVISQTYIELPADFSRIITLEIDAPGMGLEFVPTRKDLKAFYHSTNGPMTAYTLFANRIYFQRPADSVYPLTLDYYKKIPPLSGDNEDNDILLAHPDAYLHGTLTQAAIQIQDQDRIQTYGTKYNSVVSRIVLDDTMNRIPVGAKMKRQTRRLV